MIILYQSGGAGDFERLSLHTDADGTETLTFNAQQLLRHRGHENAAKVLASTSFEIWDSTNSFSDEFSILYAEVPLDMYESFRKGHLGTQEDFTLIAAVFRELGTFIRFVACELQMENGQGSNSSREQPKVTMGDILKLVNGYIGVHGGYLGDFTYRTHHEFYPEFCNIEVDTDKLEGTTREKFIKILQTSDRKSQAKIIQGVFKKYPVGSEPQRTRELFEQFQSLTNILSGAPIPNPDLGTASEVLRRVLADAETLIQKNGAISAVDRIHTALHGYLITVCKKSGIQYEKDASLTRLFRSLRGEHPALLQLEKESKEIGKVLQACAAIMDALNPVRDRLSVAHPNERLLGDEEAMLVVNITRTLLHYLDAKLGSQ